MTFQDMILTLQNFWAQRGCALLQPYDCEMGAGTFHPGTFFGSLGSKPTAIAHVPPSRMKPWRRVPKRGGEQFSTAPAKVPRW